MWEATKINDAAYRPLNGNFLYSLNICCKDIWHWVLYSVIYVLSICRVFKIIDVAWFVYLDVSR